MAFETAPHFDDSSAPKIATILAVLLVISFGLYVVYYVRTQKNDKGSDKIALNDEETLEDFLTARHSIGWRNIGWSFYASAVGSWVIASPSEFGYYGGVLTVFSYAFASAMPIVMIAYFGAIIQRAYPRLLSLSDFVYWRFGPMTQILTLLVTMLNMSIAATAEYTTLSSLYSDFVGLGDYTTFFVLLVAVVTLSYTSYGGLRASIITDRAQAVVSLFLVQVIIIYLAADFNREEVREAIEARGFNASFEFTDYNKGFNAAGYASLFTLPFSLSTATIFGEGYWQRSWAAVDEPQLKKGAWMGAALIFIVVGVFGMTGVLVSWANLVEDPYTFNANLFAFQVFSKEAGTAIVTSGIGVLVLLLATTMSESAIDSMQTGISASINGATARFFLKRNEDGSFEDADAAQNKRALNIGRSVLVVMNIPFIFIGLQKFNILSLFLLGNMICVCAFFPIMLGFFKDFWLNKYQRDWIPPVSFLLTMFSTMIFGATQFGSFSEGAKYAFWGNAFYEYQYFLFPLLATVAITSLLLGGVILYEKKFNNNAGNDAVIAAENTEPLSEVEPVANLPIPSEKPTQTIEPQSI